MPHVMMAACACYQTCQDWVSGSNLSSDTLLLLFFFLCMYHLLSWLLCHDIALNAGSTENTSSPLPLHDTSVHTLFSFKVVCLLIAIVKKNDNMEQIVNNARVSENVGLIVQDLGWSLKHDKLPSTSKVMPHRGHIQTNERNKSP